MWAWGGISQAGLSSPWFSLGTVTPLSVLLILSCLLPPPFPNSSRRLKGPLGPAGA